MGDSNGKSVIAVGESNFEEVVLKAPGMAVVIFTAPWCGPCRMHSMAFDSMAESCVDDTVFCRVNVDEQPDIASRYGIDAIPATFRFIDGQAQNHFIGAMSTRMLAEFVSCGGATKPSDRRRRQ